MTNPTAQQLANFNEQLQALRTSMQQKGHSQTFEDFYQKLLIVGMLKGFIVVCLYFLTECNYKESSKLWNLRFLEPAEPDSLFDKIVSTLENYPNSLENFFSAMYFAFGFPATTPDYIIMTTLSGVPNGPIKDDLTSKLEKMLSYYFEGDQCKFRVI